MKAKLNWDREMKFICENHGLFINLDAEQIHGGTNAGPTPKELILDAMMGCTAMDVVAILKKMRQEISGFKMEIEAENTTVHPVHFKKAVLIFMLEGNLDSEKVKKAVHVSLSKYCGVNYMISKSCKISFKILLNGNFLKEGSVEFIEPKNEEVL